MSAFGRKFKGTDAIRVLMDGDTNHWLADLLRHWRSSGQDAEDAGLRLAVRNGTLNFYRRGQSIARVSFTCGELREKTHVKYVLPHPAGARTGYVSMGRDGVLRMPPGSPCPTELSYGGWDTIACWIAAVDGCPAKGRKGYAGPEKTAVDRLVTENDDVIDLEMGLPAWGFQETAPRMDLVALEPSPGGLAVVFWEAKLVGDGRIRCSGDIEVDAKPEVLKQLAVYRRFLAEPIHRALVVTAYREAARVLVDLARVARSLGNPVELGAAVHAIAEATVPLTVDAEPRLVVFNRRSENQGAWKHHFSRLVAAGVPTLVIEEGDPFHLRYPS
jgi:hypothetical protein